MHMCFLWLLLLNCWVIFVTTNSAEVTSESGVAMKVPSERTAISHDHQETIKLHILCPPMRFPCEQLPAYCLTCDFDESCQYGDLVSVKCKPRIGVFCNSSDGEAAPNNSVGYLESRNSKDVKSLDDRSLTRTPYTVNKQFTCRYCHQLEPHEIICIGKTDCHLSTVARSFYETVCEPKPYELCLGKRVFRRMLSCNWSSGKSYHITLILSVFLGGLGADRFYLGMWAEGLGKLFTFGGLGVWTMVDFILLLTGYLKPGNYAVYG